MNYSQALEFIARTFPSFQSVGKEAYHEGLGGIVRMCRELGNPQQDYLTIHVAGTNGKGSVSHILASVLQAAGYCVGLFTSPHLHDLCERIRVNGEPIPGNKVARFIGAYGETMREMGLSYFEMTAAMAFQHFSDSEVEVAVIETGLGGRLDATNIVSPLLSIITNIGLDHADILGPTLAAIAGEKAGIIKPGVPVVVGESDAESAPVFEKRAAEMESKLTFADRMYVCIDAESKQDRMRYTLQKSDGRTQTLDLDLLGDYQQKNIVTARTAISILRHSTPLNISTRALMEGCRSVIASTGLRGRWETISRDPLVVCDVGHNAHGLRSVIGQIERQSYEKLFMVLGFVREKNLEEILPLLPHKAYYLFTQPQSERALPAETLAGMAAGYGLVGETVTTPRNALSKARELASAKDMIFVGGSTYVVAEVLPQNRIPVL